MDNVGIRLRISSEIKDEAELVFHEICHCLKLSGYL